MNYAQIKTHDVANGTGVRVSLFVSGCTHHCKGCFNQETWDFDFGKKFTPDTENELISLLQPEYIRGLSLLGGEPMEICNQRVLMPFVRKVKERFPHKDIWCYTGYTLENDLLDGAARCEVTDKFLSYIDVLVDGEFVIGKKNLRLAFRGSENQRVIDLKKTLEMKNIVLY